MTVTITRDDGTVQFQAGVTSVHEAILAIQGFYTQQLQAALKTARDSYRPPNPPPRYDDVFFDGLEALDKL